MPVATTSFQGYWPSSSPAQARNRVMGCVEPPEAAAGSAAASSSRTPSGSSCSYGETASGRQNVTNLRLPGQYDERLLASVGLQGPYYNWNRWYLPSVGRYLELDPIAKAGGFNGFYGPNWYGYAEGNPIKYADPYGTSALADRCADLMAEARSLAARIQAEFEYGDAYGYIDAGHKKKIRLMQQGLRNVLDRAKRICPNPDSDEMKQLEWIAGRSPNDFPSNAPAEMGFLWCPPDEKCADLAKQPIHPCPRPVALPRLPELPQIPPMPVPVW